MCCTYVHMYVHLATRPNGPPYIQIGGILPADYKQDSAGCMDPQSTLTPQLVFPPVTCLVDCFILVIPSLNLIVSSLYVSYYLYMHILCILGALCLALF